jgi:asparagine synthase (glutamine-hydrolysing)
MMSKKDTASGSAAEEKSFMSVQAGTWNYDGRPVDRNCLAKISRELGEYGDGETNYFDDSVGMIYRPFHTTSESYLESQPHVSVSGRVFSWDGRLDNRDDLIRQFKSSLVGDHTDLALAESAFDSWGTDSFAKLMGDWALAIWDPCKKELILARDYAGIRHLFYYPKPKSVVWCTYLEPLALCGDQFTLCEEYFASYLALWPDAHLTPYREIYPVPPGTFVSIHNGGVSLHAFWTFDPKAKIRYRTDAEYEEHFRHLFRQAVRVRLRSHAPVLADLSGGLDSSSIVCMADDILAKEGAETPYLDTFSVVLSDEPTVDDALYITLIEEKRGRIGHHAETHELGDTSPFEYASFVATPGFSGKRPEVIAKRSNVIKRGGYRVLLNGTGGDEMMGQALDPRVQLGDLLRQFRFTELLKQLRVWSLLLRRPWLHLLHDVFLLQLPASIRARYVENGKLDPWINQEFARKQKLCARQLDVGEGAWSWLPSARDWFQTIMALSRQMAHAKPFREETRYPYLDRKLVEFLMSIPTDQLLRPGDRRSLMRRALTGLLPPKILSRRKTPMGSRQPSLVFEKHWNKLESILRSPLISRLGYINQQDFQASLLAARNGNPPRQFLRLTNSLFWELWLREAVARQVISIRPEARATLKPNTYNQVCSSSTGRDVKSHHFF